MVHTPAVKLIDIGSPVAMKALPLNGLMNCHDETAHRPAFALLAGYGADEIFGVPFPSKIGLMAPKQ
jgi:hypothetical protein